MFIVGKSFFSETLSKFNIKTIAPLCVIHIPLKILAVGPLGPQYSLLFAWYELGRDAHLASNVVYKYIWSSIEGSLQIYMVKVFFNNI